MIGEISEETSPKDFRHIDICVCWSILNEEFRGFILDEVGQYNIDERKYPGITHLLRRDGDSHVIQVIVLRKVIEMIRTGRIIIS